MRPGMKFQIAALKGVLGRTAITLLALAWVGQAAAQALLVDELPSGTSLVVVNQPLADATTLVWPRPAGEPGLGQLVAGRLTLAAEIEARFGGGDVVAGSPPVIVAVGGAAPGELAGMLVPVLDEGPPYAIDIPSSPTLVEGGLERRLGAPDSDTLLRLEVLLPPPDDWRRNSVEVLWDLVPRLAADAVPSLQSRVEGQLGVLEGRVDPQVSEMALAELRMELARIAAAPTLQADDVAEARRRLDVRRQAVLEQHPEAARSVLEQWLAGGENAVRQYLFGFRGVTLESVRASAAGWLPTHPGRALLVLPPRVYNPRFAAGPEIHRLANDLTGAILERGAAPLAVVCLRPVLVPDLDGEVTATVLARLARELRLTSPRPASVRVRTRPPLIELAGPPDAFGELMEQLTTAYGVVLSDQASFDSVDGDARRRALDLMAGVLGLAESGGPSPATLLRPGNLALGVVAPDAEAAAEALVKFWSVEARPVAAPDVQDLPTGDRTRIAAPGSISVLVVALDMGFGGLEAVSAVTRELLETRAGQRWPDARVEVLAPYVPGRSLLLLVVAEAGTLDEIEARVRAGWPSLIAPVSEDELAPVRRRVAAAASAEMSGVAGHARRCSATAAGAARWREPAEFELEILTVEAEAVGALLGSFGSIESLQTTGAGVLPSGESRRR